MIKPLILLFFNIYPLSAQQVSSSTFQEIQISTKEDQQKIKKISISGVVITPTAYRNYGINEIGTAIDFNTAYYIGRLYAKNTFDWTVDKKNYLDRIGLWYFEVDGKLMLQRESKYIPAFASGSKISFTFRDSPQPTLTSPQAQFKVTSKSTNKYLSGYFVLSKKLHENFIVSLGYSFGDFGKMIYDLSEFLSDRSSQLTYNQNTNFSGYSMFFNTFYVLKGKNIIGFEVIVPQGSTFSPKLVNFQLANILKLNFQLSYLKYNYGSEVLGMISFRYSFYPRF